MGGAYHTCYKELGGVDSSTGKKRRNGKSCKNKWGTMNLQVMRFLACDIQSTHTERKSGHGVEEFRSDALKYFKSRHHNKDFAFQTVYDYLKDKPKWLIDTGQHARTAAQAKVRSLARKKRERMQVSGSDTEGSVDRGLGQRKARRVKIELSEAETKLNELRVKRDADIALFREKAVIQLKSIEADMTRARIDEEAEENRIMAMDVTAMDGVRRQYFDRKMTEIVERQANRHTSTLAAEAAVRVAEAEAAASAAASEVARNLADAEDDVQDFVEIIAEVARASPEDFTPEKETDLSGPEDMLAFAAWCEKQAEDAEIQTEIEVNGVWPEVADVEETVVTATPIP